MSIADPQLNPNKSSVSLPDRIIEPDNSDFREEFNRSSFMFSHNLAGHPLFEIPRLVELSNTILKKSGPTKVRCQVSEIPVHLNWAEIPLKEQVAEAIEHIKESGSWVLLYSVQTDPEYAALLNRVITELEDLTGAPLREEITWLDAYIFIASPHSVTPYHIDHESTFLFQVHGERNANLFNQNDRSVLTEQELENYYIGDLGAANYKEENQSKAYVYPLIPGKGVHHPVSAPHWYKNGSTYSVAIGVHMGLRSFDLKARSYQVNHYLRKLGLKPTPPGKSALQDKVKMALVGLFSKRKPETKLEPLYSGIQRIVAPSQLVKQLLKS